MRLQLISALCLLALSACGSLQARQDAFKSENERFIGKSFDELVRDKGVPTGSATLSDGGQVVEYYRTQVEIIGGGYLSYPSSSFVRNANGGGYWIDIQQTRALPIRALNKVCQIDFLVNVAHRVESWKFEGKGCF